MQTILIYIIELECPVAVIQHLVSSSLTAITHVSTHLLGVEMFKKSMDFGQAGDNVGALLRGLKRDDVKRGQVLAAVNTVKTYKKFKAEVYVLTQNEGGRHTPFFNSYRYVMNSF